MGNSAVLFRGPLLARRCRTGHPAAAAFSRTESATPSLACYSEERRAPTVFFDPRESFPTAARVLWLPRRLQRAERSGCGELRLPASKVRIWRETANVHASFSRGVASGNRSAAFALCQSTQRASLDRARFSRASPSQCGPFCEKETTPAPAPSASPASIIRG